MKHLLIASLILLAIASCQKEIKSPPLTNDFVSHIYKGLHENMQPHQFAQLDWKRMARATIDSGRLTLVRIAFEAQPFEKKFVLLQVNASGLIEKGHIAYFNLGKNSATGRMRIESLKGELLKDVELVNGYKKKSLATRMDNYSYVEPAPEYVELPEVIVTASYSSGGGISWNSWYSMTSMFEGGGGGTGWYGTGDSYTSGGGGYGGGGSSGYTGGENNNPGVAYNLIEDEIMKVSFESQYDDPAIDLQKFINCFNAIPDADATCKITIYTDVPVNDDPTKIMDWESGSPGHSWIRLEKDGVGGNAKHASQNIGFYPRSVWKTTLSDAPVAGKWVDNHHHEYNASYTLAISPASLRNALTHMLYLQKFVKYDIDDYNCTDWVLDVWKQAVSPDTWFNIPRFHLPGSLSPNGTCTPQGLYVKFNEMKAAGKPGVDVPLVGWSGASTGPCN